MDWITFLIGLLPDELIVGKIAQIANKIISDKALNERFQDLKNQILNVNERIINLEEGLERVETIIATVTNNTLLQKYLEAFLDEFKTQGSEFIVNTQNWSSQEIIRTLIKADIVTISAKDNSKNLLADSEIHATRTELRAESNSNNIIRDSIFTDEAGRVEMRGQHVQAGRVNVLENSLVYACNSSITKGNWKEHVDECGNYCISLIAPTTNIATCPSCSHQFSVKHKEFAGKSYACPACEKVSIIPLNF